MCGIFACSNNKYAVKHVINGLKALEYRGYDSWGIAYMNKNRLFIHKQVGKISNNTRAFPESHVAIGHTRWATHGGVTKINAHPHFSSDKMFALAQNGIVENFNELKKKLLKKGYAFTSETDTEVIVRLIENYQKQEKNIVKSIRKAFLNLKGRNTIIVLVCDGTIIAARNGSPLVVGINSQNNTFYLSSDVISFSGSADRTIFLDNSEMVIKEAKSFTVLSIKNGSTVMKKTQNLMFTSQNVSKGKYSHFMRKEIYETPQAIHKIIETKNKIYAPFLTTLANSRQVYTIGSGTAGAAAAQIAYYLRVYSKINTISLIGAEARDYTNLFGKNDLLIAPSQSGETADVLEILEIAQNKGVKIASYVNMPQSMISRISDYPFMSQAGPEICVMSTKIFTSQIAWGYRIAKLAQKKSSEGLNNLKILAKQISSYLHNKKNHELLQKIAGILSQKKDIFILSKGQNLQIAKEAMIKIIEGSYIHAHGIPAGDLKHYAITLIEPGTPVIFIVSNDECKFDILSAIHEVKARGGFIIGVAPNHQSNFDEYIPVLDLKETSAIMNIIPLQLLAYYMAVAKGNDVDKPRNIAKSVTVK